MYCPVCGAEYRQGFTVCSDCQVALVPDPPRNPSAHPLVADQSDDASFVLVWSGSDARIHAEICEALERQKIPARTLGSEDHLFNLATRPAFEVYVPVDLVKSAQEAIKKINAIEESVELSESDLLEIPAEESSPNDDDEDDEERDDPLNFDPQDATVQIWSGQDADLAAMIASSLRENHIPYRTYPDIPDPDTSDADFAEPPDIAEPDSAEKVAPGEMPVMSLFVLPEDDKRARAIVREIVDAEPPE
jgi:hypothetical protein